MKKLFFVLFALSSLLSAQNEDKQLTLKLITSDISIDGEIDPVWNSADSIGNFFQLTPFFNKEPSKKTIAKVLANENSFYCLIICYDDRTNIVSNTGTLDNFTGDIVSIMIDTFNDKISAYKFAVNASGVRSDCRLLDDARNRDYSWDGIWFADSKIYDWGYVVEMEIPFRSIKYNKDLKEWGLDFDRWIPNTNEDLYWCNYLENEGMRVSKFGRLVFKDFQPNVEGLSLEIYPVAITKATYLYENKYKIEPNAGIDIFYNPSEKLTFQLTGNPDFAQIEADPFNFNISRYETYFSERRPFFTEGNEIFMPSGRERNSGFYRPLELFYSRRIGKKLSDGSEVPLIFGTKAFGRLSDWEYGGFVAMTGETEHSSDPNQNEPESFFAAGRVKKTIFDNSSAGLLFVGKKTPGHNYGVLDIDGAFRGSNWQVSYQIARSFNDNEGDIAFAAGGMMQSKSWITGIRSNYIGDNFNIDQIGYVPWKGTSELTWLTGPIWYFNEGYIRQMLFYAGTIMKYENIDAYLDHLFALGFNMQFRDNWGYEINLLGGKFRDNSVKYTYWEASISSWYNINPNWNANLYISYSKSYNFMRDYLGNFGVLSGSLNYRPFNILSLGTSLDIWMERNPDNKLEDIIYDTRPYFSLTPINYLNIRVYCDILHIASSEHINQIIAGFLFSYNFLPKSWIYFAINEIGARYSTTDEYGNSLPAKMHTVNRAAVFKFSYCYYF